MKLSCLLDFEFGSFGAGGVKGINNRLTKTKKEHNKTVRFRHVNYVASSILC